MTRHHRKPKCMQGSNHPSNISMVGNKPHRAFHLLFRHGNPHYIAKMLNKLWVDPDYIFVVKRRS